MEFVVRARASVIEPLREREREFVVRARASVIGPLTERGGESERGRGRERERERVSELEREGEGKFEGRARASVTEPLTERRGVRDWRVGGRERASELAYRQLNRCSVCWDKMSIFIRLIVIV